MKRPTAEPMELLPVLYIYRRYSFKADGERLKAKI